MLPVPLVAATLAPAEATAVQVSLVMADGRLSTTGAPVTAVGPLLLTTIVYVVRAARACRSSCRRSW